MCRLQLMPLPSALLFERGNDLEVISATLWNRFLSLEGE